MRDQGRGNPAQTCWRVGEILADHQADQEPRYQISHSALPGCVLVPLADSQDERVRTLTQPFGDADHIIGVVLAFGVSGHRSTHIQH